MKKSRKKRVLMIDNFDSFTYNLVDEFEKRNCEVHVYRNDVPMPKIMEISRRFKPNLIVVSPGPSTPENAGNSISVIKEFSGKIPVFGVCLGEQAMIVAFGGVVAKSIETVHGKAGDIIHNGKGIFKGVPSPFKAGRYHSLSGKIIPNCLEVTAMSDSGVIMAVQHKEHFTIGVQFHPESILTPYGGKIIENILKYVEAGK